MTEAKKAKYFSYLFQFKNLVNKWFRHLNPCVIVCCNIIISQLMPFKYKLIKNFQKYLNQRSTNLQKQGRDNSNRSTESLNKSKHKQRKIIRKTTSVYQLTLKRQPIQEWRIVNFFNIVTLNEDALRSERCQQSYFRTLFYTKTIKKVEIRPHCLVLSLIDSDIDFPPLQYTIDRFLSFGDKKFQEIALLLQQASIKLKQLENYHNKVDRQLSSDQVEAYVTSLGKKMYCCKTENKVFISKSFLQMLEYNAEDLAIEFIKYKISLYEACSCEQYFLVMKKVFQNVNNLISLLLDKISLETFLDNSIVRFKDCLYTKNNKKIMAKMKSGMPNPFVTIFQVEEIMSEKIESDLPPYFDEIKKAEMSKARKQLRDSQFKSLRNIVNLQSNCYPQFENKVAGYIIQDSFCKQQQ